MRLILGSILEVGEARNVTVPQRTEEEIAARMQAQPSEPKEPSELDRFNELLMEKSRLEAQLRTSPNHKTAEKELTGVMAELVAMGFR
jgi:hypothetical protein